MRGHDVLREIVNDPVGDVFDAIEAQEIESFLRLREAWAFPRSWWLAAESRDGLDRLFDRLRLVFEPVHRTLNEAMAHELKTGF